jgi:alpha/beta superfamily hydrolase
LNQSIEGKISISSLKKQCCYDDGDDDGDSDDVSHLSNSFSISSSNPYKKKWSIQSLTHFFVTKEENPFLKTETFGGN